MVDDQKPVILMIDDESIILKIFERYLEKQGYCVLTADSGKKGVELLNGGGIDLVIVDLLMPEINGFEILSRARALDENLPVIVVSATEDIRDVVLALRRGAWDYLLKPIEDLSMLVHAIERALDRARLQKDAIGYQKELERKVNLKTEELERVNTRLKEVVESTKRLLNCGELQESGAVILREFGRLMDTKAGSIYRVKDDGLHLLHSLDPGHAVPFLAFPLKKGSPFSKAMESTDPFYVFDISGDPSIQTSGWEYYTDNSALFFPIVNRLGRTVAIIALHNKKEPPFLQQDREIGAILASYAGEILQAAEVESELRKSEGFLQQAQKMDAIGTLAGGIAHDFNNILSAIIGYTDLSLISETIDAPTRRNLEQIQNAGKRARDLVKQILTFSRADEVQEVVVDIGPVIQEIKGLMRATLPSSVTVESFVPDDSGHIMIDPGKIHQILLNLCTNAGHAVSDRDGRIEITCRELGKADFPTDLIEIDEDRCLSISIKDNGCGIDPAVLPRVFDPYFSTKKKGEGTGLGLAVVHGIVSKSGGAIRVSSAVGKGSCFTLFFPLVDPKSGNEDSDVPLPVETGNETILFVDDEIALGEVTGKMLSRLGYRVDVQSSSVEALKMVREHPGRYDLMITDQTMPVLSGTELSREVLTSEPDLLIILYTGYSAKVDGDAARKIGIREFLMKPVSMDKLTAVIRRLLDERKMN